MSDINVHGASMSVHDDVVDHDAYWVIDPDTRTISTTSDKFELVQGDHKSERITFEIPEIVEGHSMQYVDRIEIHYVNTNKKTKTQSKDVYIVDDVEPSEADPDMITFSWLISSNATKYVGSLTFTVQFICFEEDGETIEYKWSTEICKLLKVVEGINNAPAVAQKYTDVLEEFRNEVTLATKDYVDNSIVQSNYGTNDMTLPSYIKNRLFYYKAPMTIAEIPPNAKNYVIYACIDNLDNKSLTFTVKEKDTSTILETGFTFNADSNIAYYGDNFRIDPISVFADDHYDEFGRSKMLFTNHTDKALIFMSDQYYAKIPELYLPKAGWDGNEFLPGLMTANKYNPSNANRYSPLLVDNNGHLYTHERMKVLKAFTLKHSDVSGSTFYGEPQILIANLEGNMSHFFEDLNSIESYPVMIIPDDVCTFYFSDGQVYKGRLNFADNAPDTEPSSITELTKIGGNYYSSAQGWAEIKKLKSTSNDSYDSIGLIAGETYKVKYSQTGRQYEVQIEAAENASLGMVAVSDPDGRWAVGDTKSIVNSSWVSNGLGSLDRIYKKSVNKVIPIDAIIDADKLSGHFIVTITFNDDGDGFSTDKTSSEIYYARSRGLLIYLFIPGTDNLIPELFNCTPDRVTFVIKQYGTAFPIASAVIWIYISGDTVTVDDSMAESNENPLLIPPATAKSGDVWSIKSDGTTGWADPSKNFAPIVMKDIRIGAEVNSNLSSLTLINLEYRNTFFAFAEGTEDVILSIDGIDNAFILTPGGFSDGEYSLLYNGSIAAFVSIRGASSNIINIKPSVLGIALTVGNYAYFDGYLPKIPLDYLPDDLAKKTYVDSQISAEKDVIIKSSTEGSSKKFKITVDDAGAISATEVV